MNRGDKAAALAAVDAALNVDPHFLAALSLRERIIAGDLPPAITPPQRASAPATAAAPVTAAAAIEPIPAIEPLSMIAPPTTIEPPLSVEPLMTIAPLTTIEPLSTIELLPTVEPLSIIERLSTIDPPTTIDPPAIAEPISLREPLAPSGRFSSIERLPPIEPVAVAPAPVVPAALPEAIAAAPEAIGARDEVAKRPFGSVEGYAKFEQRAMRRRVDRRVEAARQAIEKKRLKQAAAALDEVIELDPNLPELSELTVEFDELRRAAAGGTHRGPWLVAGAVFAASVFGASWLQESSRLLSRAIIAPAPLLAAPTTSVPSDIEPVATTGDAAMTPEPPAPAPTAMTPPPATTATAAFNPPLPAPPASTAGYVVAPAAPLRPAVEPVVEAAAIVPPPSVPQPPPIAIAPLRPVQESPVVAPAVLPVPPKMNDIDDHSLVQETLQRYRSAYEDLDAQSAHAVWPAVNQVALARAFDGLESQTLTFDACDVRVRGEAATATCQGSARYVPKIGNRQPRIEPRVWNFTLHKSGTDWKIDSARAER